MPISEDEVDHKPSHQGGLSKAEQRRSNKPIMEKRRRARINHCLNELKSLILDAMKKDPARHSKLEKADILEMTVKHLQNVQRQQLAIAVATDPTVLQKFKTGFNECAGEVSRYISRIEGVDPSVRQRLLSHLASCVSGLQQLTPFSFSAMAAPGLGGFPLSNPLHLPVGSNSAGLPSVLPQVPFPAGDVNNNHARLMSGLQLIPSRLPTGELALLVPGSSQLPGVLPFFPPVQSTGASSASTPSSTTGPSATVTSGAIGTDRSHPSAFTAVSRGACSPVRSRSPHRRPQSPPLSPVSTSSGASLTSESYQSPSTPTTIPQSSSQQPQMTLVSVSTVGPFSNVSSTTEPRFKIPLGSPSTCSNLKGFHFPENLRTTTQQTFTDTPKVSFQTAPSSDAESIEHNARLDFKSDNLASVSSTSSPESSPEGIITTTCTSTSNHPSLCVSYAAPILPESCESGKDPLDFSMKKDKEYIPQHISILDTRMSPKRHLNPCSEDKGPPPKEAKFSIHFTDVRTGEVTREWNFSENPKVVKVEPMRPENQMTMDDLSKPSTSSNKDMWRPW